KFPATALLRAFGDGSDADLLHRFFAVREVDLLKDRESRTDQREVLGAIVAEEVTLLGEEPDPDAKVPKTKKARAEAERAAQDQLVRVGDELTDDVYNRLRRQGVETIKVFASYMRIDLRDELVALEDGERETPRGLAMDVIDPETGEVLAEAQ